MHQHSPLDRRSVLRGAAGAAAGLATAATVASAAPARAADQWSGQSQRTPLWRLADRKGLVFGSSIATWQLEKSYPNLHAREAGLLFTEDDLLWYQLKPEPGAPLNFGPGDQIIDFAERNQQLVIAAHLAWDEGFGEGWTYDDLADIPEKRARNLLFGTMERELKHYRGRVDGWIVANEVTDPEVADRWGFRRNVPWYKSIGPSYIARSFHLAQQLDPGAVRIINEFGFETVNEYGDRPETRRRAYLKAIDRLLDQGAPISAVGIQGHLLADDFGRRFDERGYRSFLREIADRGLPILITELDVLDEGLPKGPERRDKMVADVYRRYLDVTLDEPAVKAVIAFGLTDRYTWLDEDQPRSDGAHRRPLAFDRLLQPKPARVAIARAFRNAPERRRLWNLKKGR